MSDEINNPQHYQMFPDMQAIDVISASLSHDELIGYLKGNALKYRLRAGEKGPAEKCIAKANWYQAKLREVMGQPEMPDSFGQQNMINFRGFPAVEIGVDVRFDQTGRQEAVEQNGNDGAAYLAGSIERHPETPRHQCQACGLGHSTHACTGGES